MAKTTDNFNESELVVFGLLGLAAFIWWKGGIAGAAKAAGGAVVDAAAGVVKGAANAAGGVIVGADQSLGIPGPLGFANTDDPSVVRYILDAPNGGWTSAIYWGTPTAVYKASNMAPGSGYPPPANSPIAKEFPAVIDFGNPGGW